MMYLGLDIGKRHHDAALVDADGDVVRQLRLAPTRAGLTALGEWLGDLAPGLISLRLPARASYKMRAQPAVRSARVSGRAAPPPMIGRPGVVPPQDLWDRPSGREPAMVCGRHGGIRGRPR